MTTWVVTVLLAVGVGVSSLAIVPLLSISSVQLPDVPSLLLFSLLFELLPLFALLLLPVPPSTGQGSVELIWTIKVTLSEAPAARSPIVHVAVPAVSVPPALAVEHF
jgi:hypothetical protein